MWSLVKKVSIHFIKFWLFTRHLFYNLKQSSLSSSVISDLLKLISFKKIADFSGTVYMFYLHNCSQHFGNHTGEEILHSNPSQKLRLVVVIESLELEVIQPNLLECSISHETLKFRSYATMLFNSVEKFLEIPSVLVLEREVCP